MAVIDELAQRFNQQQGLPPVNPEAFSGRQQQAGAPAGMPPQGPQQAGVFDPTSQNSMQEYLINKVMEMKQRLGRGNVGALEGFLGGMRKKGPNDLRNWIPRDQYGNEIKYQQPTPEAFMTPRDQSGNEIKGDPKEMIQPLRR